MRTLFAAVTRLFKSDMERAIDEVTKADPVFPASMSNAARILTFNHERINKRLAAPFFEATDQASRQQIMDIVRSQMIPQSLTLAQSLRVYVDYVHEKGVFTAQEIDAAAFRIQNARDLSARIELALNPSG